MPAARRDRLNAIGEIVDLGLAICSPEGFQHFLTASMDEFSGLPPLQLIEGGQSDLVLERLTGDYEGIGF